MIIDCHVHLMDADVPSYDQWEAYCQRVVTLSKVPYERVKEKLPEIFDMTGDLVVKEMDDGGVDMCILNCVDFDLVRFWKPSHYTIEEQNQFFVKAKKRHPGRIAAVLAGIDPRRPGAAKLFEKFIKEWGMDGLKLHPTAGFEINGRDAYRLYQKAEDLQVPVMIHIGTEMHPTSSKYGDPMALDDVANDFPDVTFIGAHCAKELWPAAAEMAAVHPNVYLDLSFFQRGLVKRPLDRFYRPLRLILDIIGTPKVLFGSDFPMIRTYRKLMYTHFIKALREPPEYAREAGYEFTDEELEAILWKNAAEIFKLNV